MDTDRLFRNVSLTPMRLLTLSITPTCNLNCVHCWPLCGGQRLLPGIAAPILQRLIHRFNLTGIDAIRLTGGEPLTHPDWFAIVQWCCDQPQLKQVRLQTNGTLISDEIAQRLAALDPDRLLIEISLDGACALAHDRIRGDGSYCRTMAGLQALTRAGLGDRVVVAFTEMAHNFLELPQLLALLRGLGIARMVSATLVAAGRAARAFGIAPPTADQYRALLERYHQDRQFQMDYRRIGTIAALEWLAGRAATAPDTCRCAETPYITAGGILYPCTLLPHPALGVAAVFSRPFEDVLRQALAQWQELPQIYERRRMQLAACRDCPGQTHCGGGCPGRAVAAGHDFMQVEDRCALRKAVYSWEPGRQHSASASVSQSESKPVH